MECVLEPREKAGFVVLAPLAPSRCLSFSLALFRSLLSRQSLFPLAALLPRVKAFSSRKSLSLSLSRHVPFLTLETLFLFFSFSLSSFLSLTETPSVDEK